MMLVLDELSCLLWVKRLSCALTSFCLYQMLAWKGVLADQKVAQVMLDYWMCGDYGSFARKGLVDHLMHSNMRSF